jgi:hypothetical protein
MKIKNKKKYRLAEQLLDELVNDTLWIFNPSYTNTFKINSNSTYN